MTLQEMSNEFDISYNQVNSNQAPAVDEYEKSVFLTDSQEQFIKGYFSPKGNKFLEGFDQSQLRQYDFSTLIKTCRLNDWANVDVQSRVDKYDPRSIAFASPEDLFLTLDESILEKTGDVVTKIYQIIPINFERYTELMQKPYKFPPKNIAWRLTTGRNSVYSCYEVIGRFSSGKTIEYRMRYVKKPTPIILVNLDAAYSGMGLTIDGYHGNPSLQEEANIAEAGGGIKCVLPDGVHREIVQRAVELATAKYNPSMLSSIIGVGNASATNLGIIQNQGGK